MTVTEAAQMLGISRRMAYTLAAPGGPIPWTINKIQELFYDAAHS